MSDERQLDQLLAELQRVGVDPNTLSAGLAIRHDQALRLLRQLPDGAGPAAFLSHLRQAAQNDRVEDAGGGT